MADSTLDSELFVLIDRWPGRPKPDSRKHLPNGGILGTTHHNVASAAHPPGYKIELLNHSATAGQEGIATMIYLKLGTQNAGSALAVKDFVTVQSAALGIFCVTNNPDECLVVAGGPFTAVAISAMTDGRWGWFWCGGMCPESHVSGLAGNYETNGSVIAGLLTTNDLVADAIGLAPVAADAECVTGYALAADA